MVKESTRTEANFDWKREPCIAHPLQCLCPKCERASRITNYWMIGEGQAI